MVLLEKVEKPLQFSNKKIKKKGLKGGKNEI
jgi:hypothetical protein